MKERIKYKNTVYEFKKKDNLLYAPLNEDTDKSKSMVIYIEPRPKQRPRFTANGKHTYTPKQTQDYENLIRAAWRSQHKGIFTGYVKLNLVFFMPIPKSWNKEKQEDAVNAVVRPANTPDIDNLIKAVQDALNEIAFFDDRQIVDIQAKEYYALVPRIEITVTEL